MRSVIKYRRIMSKISWGIIGCGDVAEVKSGPAFQKAEGSGLLAVMRRDGLKAKDFAERHGVPLWYDNASNIFKNKDINAVYIATPPSTHLKYALQALKAGKDVYLEKPMVLNKEEASILYNAVKESKNKLTVAHYRRYLPAFLKVKSLLDENTIGELRFSDIQFLQPLKSDVIAKSEVNWRLNPEVSGGGLFHDIAPHQIDLMCYFFGDYIEAKGVSTSQNKEVDDIVNGLITFKSGVQFRGVWCFNVSEISKKDNCTIYGSKGSISFSFYGEEVILDLNGHIHTFKFENPKHVQQPMIQETVDYLLEKRNNPCSVAEGLVVTTIMDAFLKK
jgi:predicted dehydrogenase